MIEVLEDAIMDSIKLLPFLFITYLLMEYIEHKTSEKAKSAIKKSGKFGPLYGSLLGAFPQCGFSVAATNFYSARVITLGTLIAVYLSTSDEMIPIFISEAVPITTMLLIIGLKIVIGMIAGFIIDFILRKNNKNNEEEKIVDLCEKEHCHCEHGIFKSSLKHTFSIWAYILVITALINILIYFVGEETVSNFISNKQILGPIIAGIIGLIPNCASSVIITKMYLSNVINFATMMSRFISWSRSWTSCIV